MEYCTTKTSKGHVYYCKKDGFLHEWITKEEYEKHKPPKSKSKGYIIYSKKKADRIKEDGELEPISTNQIPNNHANIFEFVKDQEIIGYYLDKVKAEYKL